MSALPYQPVPTAHQQLELERWVQRKYPVRQYRDNVDEAIAEAMSNAANRAEALIEGAAHSRAM